jgi:hypothetical protein
MYVENCNGAQRKTSFQRHEGKNALSDVRKKTSIEIISGTNILVD